MIKISKKVISLILENQRKTFDGVVSPKWGMEGQVRDHFSSEEKTKIHFEKLKNDVSLNKKMKILDLGCGYGFMVVKFRQLGFEAYGCDVDGESVLIAQKILRDNNLDPRLIVKNGEKLPYRSNSFDLIYLKYVLVYVKNLRPLFKEIKRVLKENGKVYLITPNYQCGYDVNYGFFLIPWLPRWLNMLYISLRGRKSSFFKDLSLTTKRSLEKIFKENHFQFENIGIRDWFALLKNPNTFGRSKAFINFISIIRKFHLESLFLGMARLGFYTPLVYVAYSNYDCTTK